MVRPRLFLARLSEERTLDKQNMVGYAIEYKYCGSAGSSMSYWNKYALAAVLATAAAAFYMARSRADIPSDIRDAPKAYEELANTSGPAALLVQPQTPQPPPPPDITAKQIAQARSYGAYGIALNSNLPDDFVKLMLLDLELLAGIRPNDRRPTSLHSNIFGRVHGDDYLRFLGAGVAEIRMGPVHPAETERTVAYVSALQPSVINLRPRHFSYSEIFRIATLVHETRHTGKTTVNWPHVKCPGDLRDAALRGRVACDGTPLGAYGATCVMMESIPKNCANCGGKVRMDAELYSWETCDRVLPSQRKPDYDLGSYSTEGVVYGVDDIPGDNLHFSR